MSNTVNKLAQALVQANPRLRTEFGLIIALLSRRVIDANDVVQLDADDLAGSLSRLLGSSGAAAAISALTSGTDLTTSGVLTTLGTNIGAHDTQGVTLLAALLATTGAGAAIATTGRIVTTSTPVTTNTVTASASKVDEIVNLTPAGTLAALTFTFPSNTNSRIGQELTLTSSQIVTTLTVSSSGLTLNGTAVTALAVNTPVRFVKTAGSTWLRIA